MGAAAGHGGRRGRTAGIGTPLNATLQRALSRLPPPAKRSGKALWSGWARLTSGSRLFPDYVIIGAQRGGTTSLYNYLAWHPAVGRALTKEVRFFDQSFDKGLDWYRSRFPSEAARRRLRNRTGMELMVGEASPDYLFYPRVPARLAAVIPDAKLIVALRDPGERAYSHYCHQVRRGFEDLTFDAAIAAEPARVTPGDDVDFATHHFSYLARGHYAEQLERWFAHVPREQVLVLRSEDLFADPAAVYAQVLAFLDLPDWRPLAFPDLNHMTTGTLSDSARTRCREHFAPHNQRLAALLGRDFGWDPPRL